MTDTFCPKHFTLEDVDCEEAIVACPPRVPIDPSKHVIASCGPCNRTRVVPVSRIMQGKVHSAGMCVLSECAATVIVPEATPAPSINQAAKPKTPSKATSAK
jgi:hypothetical protein